MNRRVYFAFAFGAGILANCPAFVAAQESKMVAMGNEQTGVSVAAQIDVIRRAPNPSAAVDAYAKGLVNAPDSVPLEEAYLVRMVELGVPEMADAQARDLIQRQTGSGVAWAVAAFNDAERGQPVEALGEIATAVQHQARDPFVQRTAGQLLAWYDTEADQSQVPDDVKSGVSQIRALLSGQRAYGDAYRRAHAVYDQDTSTASTASAPPTTEPAPPTEYPAPPAEPPAPLEGGDTYNYNDTYMTPNDTYVGLPSAYPYPYAFPYAYSYDPFCGYPAGYCGSLSWISSPGAICVPRRFFFHGDADDFRFHHGDRDGFAFHRDRGDFGFFGRQHGFGFDRHNVLVPGRHDHDALAFGRFGDAGRIFPHGDRGTVAPGPGAFPARPARRSVRAGRCRCRGLVHR